MKAFVLRKETSELQLETLQIPVIGDNDVLIKMKSAALNRRDVWICKGKYAKIEYPAVLGSDGSGIVEKIGNNVSKEWLGQEVVIHPSLNWGENPSAQSKNYSILGMPTQGTLAEYCAVPAENIFPKPVHLSFDEAGAFPLAYLTAYRAVVRQANVLPGHKVLITGIGGGVALAAFDIARALGARVYATTSSDDKLLKFGLLGGNGGAIYTTDNWDSDVMMATNGFDVIIDSAGGPNFNKLTNITVPGGTIAVYGATVGAVPELNLHRIFWKQLKIIGSTMGNTDDFRDMLAFMNTHKLRPVIDSVFTFENTPNAFTRMAASEQFGKIVVRISE
ncbi:MAG: zinc-binding dehydrogenase [Ignavibacteria bacterium]|nr:zinc-binding dehydrogenase [Ignavibacteria bacterium]